MGDTELLVLAAKAAGYPAEVVGDQVWINGDYMAVTPTRPWWPLTDDGDALRLAVKLNMNLSFDASDQGPFAHTCFGYDGAEDACALELLEKDASAATRRAIVKAAAEIGRAMP